MYTVIVENDVSQWDDQTGSLYHFPKRYSKHLLPGTKVVYYKSGLKLKAFKDARLHKDPHYFATAVIGDIHEDKEGKKGALYAEILEYQPFDIPVLAKYNNEYFERIPESQKANYWRNGVRPIIEAVYVEILDKLIAEGQPALTVQEPKKATLPKTLPPKLELLNDASNTLESAIEGKASTRYVTTYERDPRNRKIAIAEHGLSCKACGFNFGDFYGEYAEGFIHVHHINPVSKLDGPTQIDPKTDLVPLCANCHSVVHRRKDKTLSIEELKALIRGRFC